MTITENSRRVQSDQRRGRRRLKFGALCVLFLGSPIPRLRCAGRRAIPIPRILAHAKREEKCERDAGEQRVDRKPVSGLARSLFFGIAVSALTASFAAQSPTPLSSIPAVAHTVPPLPRSTRPVGAGSSPKEPSCSAFRFFAPFFFFCGPLGVTLVVPLGRCWRP